MIWQRSHNLEVGELGLKPGLLTPTLMLPLSYFGVSHTGIPASPLIDCVTWTGYITFLSLVFLPVKWELIVIPAFKNIMKIQ